MLHTLGAQSKSVKFQQFRPNLRQSNKLNRVNSLESGSLVHCTASKSQ